MPKKKVTSSKPTKAKPKKWGTSTKEKTDHFHRDIYVEDELITTIKEEVPKMKMITPSLVAQKYSVRISVVKRILQELIEANKIKSFIQTSKLKVFVPA